MLPGRNKDSRKVRQMRIERQPERLNQNGLSTLRDDAGKYNRIGWSAEQSRGQETQPAVGQLDLTQPVLTFHFVYRQTANPGQWSTTVRYCDRNEKLAAPRRVVNSHLYGIKMATYISRVLVP